MSSKFDPYHEWLGIPPKDQPPNHYRLLGVEAFESGVRVLEAAAEQRAMLLRSRQMGEHSRESQKLLNEVANARSILLSPEKKAQYDEQLRNSTRIASGTPSQTVPRGIPIPTQDVFGTPVMLESNLEAPQLPPELVVSASHTQRTRPHPTPIPAIVYVAGACGIAAILVIAGVLLFHRPPGDTTTPPSVADEQSPLIRPVDVGKAKAKPELPAPPGSPSTQPDLHPPTEAVSELPEVKFGPVPAAPETPPRPVLPPDELTRYETRLQSARQFFNLRRWQAFSMREYLRLSEVAKDLTELWQFVDDTTKSPAEKRRAREIHEATLDDLASFSWPSDVSATNGLAVDAITQNEKFLFVYAEVKLVKEREPMLDNRDVVVLQVIGTEKLLFLPVKTGFADLRVGSQWLLLARRDGRTATIQTPDGMMRPVDMIETQYVIGKPAR